MRAYFLAPFPLFRHPLLETLVILAIGVFVVAFLLVFEPFGTDSFKSTYRNQFLMGYGVITSGVFLLFRFLITRLNTHYFNDDSWTVGKQILWIFAAFAAAISFSYLYWAWFFSAPVSLTAWWGFTGFGLSIGLFPIIGLITADYVFQLKRHVNSAATMNSELSSRHMGETQSRIIRLSGENTGESLELANDSLLYLQAANNYVEIHFLQDNNVRQLLFRTSIKELEANLPSPPWFRTHRSYLVNLDKVQRISGNAQGHRLHLHSIDESLPVSRGRADACFQALNPPL